MTFSLLLAFRVVALVIAIVLVLGGGALMVIGAVRMLRRPAPPKPHEPGYSTPVEYEGPEQVPAGFEDSPRWVDASVTSETPGSSSHVAPFSNADLRAHRRSGIAFFFGGLAMLIFGVILTAQFWTFLG